MMTRTKAKISQPGFEIEKEKDCNKQSWRFDKSNRKHRDPRKQMKRLQENSQAKTAKKKESAIINVLSFKDLVERENQLDRL